MNILSISNIKQNTSSFFFRASVVYFAYFTQSGELGLSVVEKKCNTRLAEARKVFEQNSSWEFHICDDVYSVPSFNPECQNILYNVIVGENGFYCTCHDFLFTLGQPCKHIYYVLLKINVTHSFSNLQETDSHTLLQQACLHFGINVEENSTSTYSKQSTEYCD